MRAHDLAEGVGPVSRFAGVTIGCVPSVTGRWFHLCNQKAAMPHHVVELSGNRCKCSSNWLSRRHVDTVCSELHRRPPGSRVTRAVQAEGVRMCVEHARLVVNALKEAIEQVSHYRGDS